MKRIKNISVRLSERAAKLASDAGIAMVDSTGIYTTTAHFLCGENPWGLHQDFQFSSNISAIRQGHRICAAAEQALTDEDSYIVLAEEEHAALVRVLATPYPSELTPIHPMLAREVLALFEEIELARGEE